MGSEVLPRQILELVDLIGWPATEALVQAVGGMRVYVPRVPAADHRVAQAVGDEVFAALVQHYGGGTIYVPMCAELARERRRRDIRARYEAGESPNEIAGDLKVSLRYVERALKRPDLDLPTTVA